MFEVHCPKCKNEDFEIDDVYDVDGQICAGEITEKWYCHCEKCGHSFTAYVTAETKITAVDYYDD